MCAFKLFIHYKLLRSYVKDIPSFQCNANTNKNKKRIKLLKVKLTIRLEKKIDHTDINNNTEDNSMSVPFTLNFN